MNKVLVTATATSKSLLKAFYQTCIEAGLKVDTTWNSTQMDKEGTMNLHACSIDGIGFYKSEAVDPCTQYQLPAQWDDALAAFTAAYKKPVTDYKPEGKGKVRVTAEQLRMRLQMPIPVRFDFEKKDGTLRHAVGTRYVDNIPGGAAPTGSRKESATALSYYDYTVQAWRSLTKDTVIYLDTDF